MGTYDVNLTKNKLGYQFDRNVYIGYQTNDNRVVTVKELRDLNIGGVSGGPSTVDITLTGNRLQTAPSDNLIDSITFTKDAVSSTFNIVPQYLSPTTTNIPNDAKLCLVVADSNGVSTVYQSDVLYSQVVTQTSGFNNSFTLKINNIAVATYNGSAATSYNFSTLATTPASVIAITDMIATDTPASSIPNVGAVRNYASTGTLSNPLDLFGTPFTGATTMTISAGTAVQTEINGNTITIHASNTYVLSISDIETMDPDAGTATFTVEMSEKLRSMQYNIYVPQQLGSVTLFPKAGLMLHPSCNTQDDVSSGEVVKLLVYTADDAVNISPNHIVHIIFVMVDDEEGTGKVALAQMQVVSSEVINYNPTINNYSNGTTYTIGTIGGSPLSITLGGVHAFATSLAGISSELSIGGLGIVCDSIEQEGS